jgi:hypothetical protein
VLKTFGENSKRQRLNTGEGFVTARAVTERTWQVADLGNPSTVVFAFEFDREANAHGSNVTRRQKDGRPTACTRPAGVLAVVSFGLALTALPDKVPYPFTDPVIAAQWPGDYLWMFPAMLLMLAFVALCVAVHEYAAPDC